MFLPLFFGLQFLEIGLLLNSTFAFIAFSLMASAVYVMNDNEDQEYDKLHPIKKFRPIASGAITRKEACFLFIILVTTSLGLSLYLNRSLALILLVYLLINIGYTKLLKHIILLDVLCISSGFLLRLKAGAVVTDIELSYWIIGITLLLSLFLALGKRRDDVLSFNKSGALYRKTAANYTLKLVDTLIILVVVILIIGYVLYTVSPVIMAQMGSSQLFLTSIWVVLGLSRYLYLIFRTNKSGSPTAILVTDLWLQLTIIAWILNFFLLIY